MATIENIVKERSIIANGDIPTVDQTEDKKDQKDCPRASGDTADQHQESFQFSSKLNLEDIRTMQAKFCEERDWDQYHTPRNILLAMVGEVGELAELFQWRGECQRGLPDWSDKDKHHLGQELSDVLIYLVRLAERCNVDLPKAVIDKFEHNRRKYPVDKVKGSSKKYTEYKEAARKSSSD